MNLKIRIPERSQCQMRTESLNMLLPPDHPARVIWDVVCELDLSAWMSRIASKKGEVGTPALDPRVLVSLWLQATFDGINSARALSRLCESHLAYRWICGDEPVNYHSLADFRTSNPEWLDGLLAQTVAALMHAGVADLKRVAQDGVRVRANAGKSSFRRRETLEECLVEAEEEIRKLQEADDSGDSESPRSSSAQERATRERKEKLDAALAHLKELEEANAERYPSLRKDASALRASTTDAEARKMKMANGGYDPAYNVQFATTVAGGVVVGVAVTNEGVDSNQLEPMMQKIQATYGESPETVLVDGGFGNLDAFGRAEDSGIRILSPIREEEKKLAKGQDPYARNRNDTNGSAVWRARMGTAEAKEEYKERSSTAEWVNAQARNRGLQQFRVRGLDKVRSTSLWYGLAHNISRMPEWQVTK
jgi:transposase